MSSPGNDWSQPHGAPRSIPPGWPGQYKNPYHPYPQVQYQVPGENQPPQPVEQNYNPRPFFPKNDPGPWKWMDLVTVVAYGLIMFLGVAYFVLLVPGVLEFAAWMAGTEPATPADIAAGEMPIEVGMVLNLINYVVLFVLALISCWSALIHSFQAFKRLWGLKLLIIPGTWVLYLLITTAVTLTLGEPEVSENQAALESMTSVTPIWLMIFTVVIAGPLVEEYLFRHLMIGKLSRLITVWAAVPVSTVLFAALHFVSAQDASLVQAVPYLVMGLLFSLLYVITRYSLAFAYVQHGFHNLVSVILLYTLPDSFLNPEMTHILQVTGAPLLAVLGVFS